DVVDLWRRRRWWSRGWRWRRRHLGLDLRLTAREDEQCHQPESSLSAHGSLPIKDGAEGSRGGAVATTPEKVSEVFFLAEDGDGLRGDDATRPDEVDQEGAVGARGVRVGHAHGDRIDEAERGRPADVVEGASVERILGKGRAGAP